MDPRFETYAASVCQQVRYATKREQAQIRKELTDHMEDHAQALLNAGYDADHAQQVALDHMGDPTEVGKALNQAYPLVWYLFSRLALFLLVLTAIYAAQYIRYPLETLTFHQNMRQDPITYALQTDGFPHLYPLDIRQELPNGCILEVFAAGLEPSRHGAGYDVYLCTVSYCRQPFAAARQITNDLTITWDDPEGQVFPAGGGGTDNYYYWNYHLLSVPVGTTPTLTYDRYGTAFSLKIPLPWEEVLE